jgi:excinuclease ABC subunit B
MARSPKSTPSGFEEAPQSSFEGAPMSGSVSDWVKQLEAEAEQASRGESMREIRSKAGKHRKSVENDARRMAETGLVDKRSSRGASLGGSNDPRTRAAAGLNPVAGLDISLEEAERLRKLEKKSASSRGETGTEEAALQDGPSAGVTATVAALSKLIESGNPLFKDGKIWTPHRPARPEKSEGGIPFQMVTDYAPNGDQPAAIKDLSEGLKSGERSQVLLGVTGSGKTFTMAQVINETQRPAVILAPNKTLAAQLYSEFKNFFPHNAVEYFVSYYDYYQPEAYVPRTDTYIEKESTINEQIDRMRHAATRAILERDDCIIVASVSCIYGIGSVETYTAMTFQIEIGDHIDQRQLLADLVAQQYKRREMDFQRGSFRVRGDTIELFPAHLEDAAWRITMFGDEVEAITEFDPLTGQKTGDLKSVKIYANSHYVTPRPALNSAIKSIKEELKFRLAELEKAGRLLEAQRLEQRTRYDLEMLEATGSCQGIENYSRYLTGRKPGEPPPTLFEYIPDNAILFIDESHVTVPQIGGMYRGDFRRKATLAEFGFRLPSCMDNRPLRFEEWDAMRPETVSVSATPGNWEMEQAGGVFAEQVIRPTGLIDPPVEVRPARSQVDDVLGEIRETTLKGYRTLVTVLTKRMAEDLTEYLHEQGIRVRYMHSDIDTLERIEILRDLRLGAFDVLVGINLLREGLDIPECGFVAILDADKEGFLRSETSLIQTIGRAARNVDGKVILYADQVTGSMERAMGETARRREKQMAWNQANGITPESVKAKISDILDSVYEKDHVRADIGVKGVKGGATELVGGNMQAHLNALEKQMRDAAADLDFETAARLRDEIKRLKAVELAVMDDPIAREEQRALEAKGSKLANGGKTERRRESISSLEGELAPSSLFKKPDLDNMGPGTDMERPVRTQPPKDRGEIKEGSLFRKPALDDMGRDIAEPVRRTSPAKRGEEDQGADERASLFHKPTLDDMRVDPTHHSPRGQSPSKRDNRSDAGAGETGLDSEFTENPGYFKRNSLDEMTVRRTEKPLAANPLPEKPADPAAKTKGRFSPLMEGQPERLQDGPKDDGFRPVIRAKTGVGSYEDPTDRKRGKGKSGKPGA